MTEVTVKLKNEFSSALTTVKDKHTYRYLYPLTIYQTEENQVL
ncbi:hypothetical protein [Prevotella histicola]|uniref:Uncharacterized protein n=1 Tax=Prevotella histicola F0411 TaxID=857291 RepID=G6AGV0_9BACT|nr:hypothetical protein [Prevotella histicola]EHG16134.1 hypothetical protein HMPREF9138_01296 [Prevotella histicola F0411]